MTESLTDAVHDLVNPWTDVVATDGRRQYKPVDHEPLLVMLRNAIRSSTGRTAGGGREVSARNVIDPAAFELWETITRDVREWTRRHVRDTPNPLLGYAVRTVAERVDALWASHQVTEEEYTRMIRRADWWRRQIWSLFDKPVEKEILAPCPNCEQVKVSTVEGEIQSALVASYRKQVSPMARCRHCGYVWEGQAQLLILGRMIGAEMDHETLAEMGMTSV